MKLLLALTMQLTLLISAAASAAPRDVVQHHLLSLERIVGYWHEYGGIVRRARDERKLPHMLGLPPQAFEPGAMNSVAGDHHIRQTVANYSRYQRGLQSDFDSRINELVQAITELAKTDAPLAQQKYIEMRLLIDKTQVETTLVSTVFNLEQAQDTSSRQFLQGAAAAYAGAVCGNLFHSL